MSGAAGNRRAVRQLPAAAAGQTDERSEAGQAATHSLERALLLMKVFQGSAKPLSHAELVRRSGYSKASVSRLTATLVALGYLDRAPDGVRVQVGVRGLRLGQRYLSNSLVQDAARPIMQDFADRFDMSVGLAVADQLDMVYIQYCNGRKIATLRLGVGRSVPMALSSIGRAYVWSQSPEQRQRLLFGIWKKSGEHGPQVVARMERAFGELEAHGYCLAAGEYQRDTFAISVPLALGNPPLHMGLNCSAVGALPDREVIREQLAPALMKTARLLMLELEEVDSSCF
ncbi:IclR family transcriptional regulator [Herbaspirillum frisingense]|uniref:DNA-binding IclR family transcriptional regulator n=1 Tax=Herbaspirillum frisingense TaxID=92645 RepID=A0ABU1PF16_9BURK|nr:helix-turn-helix domain-containing protein [Herbaspirillum frisingense]MDR6584526.1 DNA-binding IclR family transcriptional regulator [Herbaspirillum frisingense]